MSRRHACHRRGHRTENPHRARTGCAAAAAASRNSHRRLQLACVGTQQREPARTVASARRHVPRARWQRNPGSPAPAGSPAVDAPETPSGSAPRRADAAAGAPRHLHDGLRETFARAEIRAEQALVGVHRSRPGHVRKVMTLGEHLRTDQDACFAVVDARERFFESPRRPIRRDRGAPTARAGKICFSNRPRAPSLGRLGRSRVRNAGSRAASVDRRRSDGSARSARERCTVSRASHCLQGAIQPQPGQNSVGA